MMLARLLSIVSGAALAVGLPGTAGPGFGAGGCVPNAPSSARVGSPLEIRGTGFPASSAVDVTFVVDGGTPDAFSIQSEATGRLSISLTPEAADEGVTTVTATSGSACSATVTFTVVGPNDPAPTSAPAASQAAAGTSTAPSSAPRTDTVLAASTDAAVGSSAPWLLALGCLAIGIGSLAAARRRRSR
ncbi:MAG: hypothetical protein HY262_07755 [Chloroflexi bacterium]|nr:hypothetical protein [Chloroflexota bacterium]